MKVMEPTIDPSFHDVVRRLQSGDEQAAYDIFQRYAQGLANLASRKIVGNLRQKVDAEDLVQSAFKSFFRANSQGAFDIKNWDDLWAILTTITLRKCGYQVRKFLTSKRDLKREQKAVAAGDDSSASWIALAREPTPAEAAILNATVEEVLTGLADKARDIVELTLQGLTVPEIAPRVGLSERSVFRQLERVKSKLMREVEE